MADYIIETHDLTKSYGIQISVKNINIHIRKGTIYGLLGRNGAGKTTTMKMLINLVRPTSGEIDIFGMNVEKNAPDILPRIGSLIEAPGFYPNLTGTENLKIFATLRGVPSLNAIKEALDVVGLPYKDKKLFSQYSLGMKQRLAMANAIMHDPEILILDEPTNGLDPIGIAELREFILKLSREQNKTVVISSHLLPEIELLADDIGIIHKGSLLEEESLKNLENKNGKYYYFNVSDSNQAVRLLEQTYKVVDLQVEDDCNFRIYDTEIPIDSIIRSFVECGLNIYDVHLYESSLEDYFKHITGGEGIA